MNDWRTKAKPASYPPTITERLLLKSAPRTLAGRLQAVQFAIDAGRLTAKQAMDVLEGPTLDDVAGIPTNVPLVTPSQRRGESRWAATERAAAQRSKVRREAAKWLEMNGPVLRITVTRVAPRRIDQPNLGQALKHVIDGLSDAMRIDDGSLAVDWVLTQRKGSAAVEWKIEAVK